MIVESTLTSHTITPAGIGTGLQSGQDPVQTPARCQRRNNPYTVCHGPYSGGTSCDGAPTRTRHRTPSINCRLLHLGGRPGFSPTGSSGCNSAHCASVKLARHVVATLATRSSVVRVCLVANPSTGDLATFQAPIHRWSTPLKHDLDHVPVRPRRAGCRWCSVGPSPGLVGGRSACRTACAVWVRCWAVVCRAVLSRSGPGRRRGGRPCRRPVRRTRCSRCPSTGSYLACLGRQSGTDGHVTTVMIEGCRPGPWSDPRYD